ncbi:MAG: putative DsbA family dithiol-disulfide isomerase [Hyphomicrobiaceae bacterium]|jgi:predicted DsbA family dithiol-disulfide isomerase
MPTSSSAGPDVSSLTSHVTLIVWSDILCPWCYNAAVVLDRLEDEFAGTLTVTWRRYLLRPEAQEKSLERFRGYTESWQRPASAPEAARFRVWSSEEAPPSHSVPPNVAVIAAERQSDGRAFHLALMDAYFWENRNVTARATILDVAKSCDLDMERFERDLDDPTATERVWNDHREAIHRGISSVPTVAVTDDFVIPGAQDANFYRRMIEKLATREATT